jgi:hypothetical protein
VSRTGIQRGVRAGARDELRPPRCEPRRHERQGGGRSRRRGRLFPDRQFVVFHAAWDPSPREGPYDPADSAIGINSLIKALDDHGIPPNGNVWVDLGTTWRTVLTDPDQAAHVLGKLLSRVGEDRLLWGTDAIWYGSPQPQIMAFRAFNITVEYQDRFKYPALINSGDLPAPWQARGPLTRRQTLGWVAKSATPWTPA